MKKLFIALIVITCVLDGSVAKAAECPFGVESDPAPGLCGRYADIDRDRQCDYALGSQSKEADIVKSEEIYGQSENYDNANAATAKTTGEAQSKKNKYNFIPLTLVLFALYLLSQALVRSKKLAISSHLEFASSGDIPSVWIKRIIPGIKNKLRPIDKLAV